MDFFLPLKQEGKEKKFLMWLAGWVKSLKEFIHVALKKGMRISLKQFKDWMNVAFVSDKEWRKHTVEAVEMLIPAKVLSFENIETDAAIKWCWKMGG